jgi:4-amino-4-deoxy-L-arabinose transferase-like glycosyltransferase
MTRGQKALLVLLLAPYVTGLSRPDLWDANETLYAEPPREALETGAWFVPTMNYEPWYVKPPGVTWVTLPFYAVLGPTEFAGRLPMALAAILTILLTYAIGARTGGARVGLLAAAILATTAKFFMFSRQLAGDVFLTTCFAAAAYAYVRWTEGGARRWLYAGAVALAAGALMKGPVALLLPPVPLILHRRRVRPFLGPFALSVALAAPWFVYMAVAHGEAFLDTYFGAHHVSRVLTTQFGGGRGALFYPLAFLGDGLPWSLLAPLVVPLAWRDPRARLPLLWCGTLLLVLTLSTGKRSVYLLPLYPAYATVAALAVERVAARWLLVPLLACAPAAAALTVVLSRLLPRFAGPAWVLLALALLWTAAVAWAWRRRAAAFGCLASAALLSLAQAWFALHLDLVDPYRPARFFAETIAREAAPGDRCVRYGVGLQSLTFYGRRPFVSLRDPERLRELARKGPRTWVVLPEVDLPLLAGDPALHAEVVARRPYLQLSLPGLRGRKPLERQLLLVRVEAG